MTQIKHHIGKLSRINPLKVTTDKLAAYKNALQSVFTDIDYAYLQIVKKRVKMRLVTVKKCFVKGTEDDFKGKTQNQPPAQVAIGWNPTVGRLNTHRPYRRKT